MTKKFSIPPKTNILAEGIHPDTWERLCLTAVLQQKPKFLVMDCNSDVVLQLSANSLTKWGTVSTYWTRNSPYAVAFIIRLV